MNSIKKQVGAKIIKKYKDAPLCTKLNFERELEQSLDALKIEGWEYNESELIFRVNYYLGVIRGLINFG